MKTIFVFIFVFISFQFLIMWQNCFNENDMRKMHRNLLLIFLVRCIRCQFNAVGYHCITNQTLNEISITIVWFGLSWALHIAVAVMQMMIIWRWCMRKVGTRWALSHWHPFPSWTSCACKKMQQLLFRWTEACVMVIPWWRWRFTRAFTLFGKIIQAIVFAINPIGMNSPFFTFQVFGDCDERKEITQHIWHN